MSAAHVDSSGNVIYTPVRVDSDGRTVMSLKGVQGGNLSLTTALGAANVLFTDQACDRLAIVNTSGADVEFQQDAAGAYFTIVNGTSFTVTGISNANQIGVRRVDQSAVETSVVKARWESNV